MKPNNDSGATNTLENEKSEQNNEHSLITVLGLYLKSSGIAISDGAIRDLPETSYNEFDAVQAVNALKLLNFDASFGKVKFRRIFKLKFENLICFDHSGTAFLLEQGAGKDSFTLTKHEYGEIVSTQITKAELKAIFSEYAIISVRQLGESTEKSDRNWFFGSLAKGKFLYFQVIFAASVSNFLGLSTSLFIMVVYDRVVPNEAIESLIALTVGVAIALGFDLIIKCFEHILLIKQAVAQTIECRDFFLISC